MFDVFMGSYYVAEACELVRLFILKILAKHLGKSNEGLFTETKVLLL